MLQLRPNCECCNRDLPPGSAEARICSFECTFCEACASGVLGGRCPNCGGERVPRPRRLGSALEVMRGGDSNVARCAVFGIFCRARSCPGTASSSVPPSEQPGQCPG